MQCSVVQPRLFLFAVLGALSLGAAAGQQLTAVFTAAQAQAGRGVYDQNCSGCHGADPKTGSQNIGVGNTVAGLNTAFKLSPMTNYATSLTSTDILNLAAYIKSRVP